MKLSSETRAFCKRLGYQFDNGELLVEALTHPSKTTQTRPSNQRLEFLGDRVLNLVIAEALFQEDAAASEGKLAPRYNALIRKEACAEVAREIGLGEVMRMGRGEQLTGGRKKDASLGDAMEAVLAAIYIDGGLEAARKVILALWGERVAGAEEMAGDAKTALQEWAQARKLGLPEYAELSREGPAHEPVFVMSVRLSNGQAAEARAGSKRQAEQAAAQSLLKALQTS